MKRHWLALLITIAMIAATYGMIPFIAKDNRKQTAQASQGVLDLSQWRFDRDGAVKLDGQWEFYPNRLLDAADFAGGGGPAPETIAVPSSWASKTDVYGSATYRLLLHMGDRDRTFGLKTLSIQMSSRIIVNGEEVASSGIPSGEPSSYEGKNKPSVSYFTLQSGMNELIVQAANYHFPGGSGINHSMYLGYPGQITAIQSKALAHDWIVFICFFMMGLYFVGLYSQRRNDFSLLVFGLLCLFFALFCSTRGERILYDMFGSIPTWLYLRLQISSSTGAGMALLLYLYTAFRPFSSRLLVRIGLVVGALLLFLELFFYPWTQTVYMLPVTSLMATLPFIYGVYVLMSAALRKVEGTLYLVLAAIALNVHAFIQNINIYFAVPVFYFKPIEPFVFLLMLALLMSLRFSNAFKQNENLSARLLHADKLKDEFLTNTAHEFKTPLHGMMNIAQSMIDDTRQPLAPGHQERAELIALTAKKLSRLVYDILDLSKLKEGELSIHPMAVDLRSTVEVSLKVFSYLIAGKDVRLVNRIPDDFPYVLADEFRLKQIIGNLLDNALKHTASGTIGVSAEAAGGMAAISVQDTGGGIDEDELPFIFQPFKTFRIDSKQSFGLGLPIVKQLVELQQGTIRVSSSKGEGTTFTLTLPIADPDQRAKRGIAQNNGDVGQAEKEYEFRTPYVAEGSGPYTVLVVDDHFSNLKVLIDVLGSRDYTVIAVKNGLEAIWQIENRPAIDLVILDLMMPGLSGFEVCRAIRRKHSMLEMPVLMVTASIQEEDKLAAFDAGANDYLPKPFDANELKARVKSLLLMKEAAGKAVDLEVAFLQSQIKPHFLYNVLNTVIALSYTNTEKARKLTGDLADYLRGSFSFSNIQKSVPLHNELALIRAYVDIEKERFRDRIKVEYEVDERVLGFALPPLLLQPLVENAIRHGIGKRTEGGTVEIKVHEADGHCRIVIADNGVGMTQEQVASALSMEYPVSAGLPERRTGVGLRNINTRLKHAYATELHIESEVDAGTTVTVLIPASGL